MLNNLSAIKAILICLSFSASSGCWAQNAWTKDTLTREQERFIYATELESQALKAKDTFLLAEAYYLFGKSEMPSDNINAAIWFHKALKLLEHKPPSFEKGRLFVQLGNISSANGLLKDKAYYHSKAKDIFIQSKSERGFKQFKNLFLDIEAFVEANNSDLRTFKHEIMGVAYHQFKKGEMLKARRNFEKLIKVLDERNNSELFMRIITVSILSRINTKENRLEEAKLMIDQADLLLKSGFAEHNVINGNISEAKYDYAVASKDWKQAHDNLIKINKHQLEKAEADRNAAISKLKIEYDVELKEEQLDLKELELTLKEENLRLQKIYSVSLGVILILLILLLLYVFKLFKTNKRISRRNALLLVEQNHRVKNNLQFISSMLNVQKDTLKDQPSLNELKNIQLRIESMAILQRTLYSDGEVSDTHIGDFLEEVVENVLICCDREDVETEFNILDAYLPSEVSLPLGLIITELCINSCKHAFEFIKEPKIFVSLIKTKKELVLDFGDNGNGLDNELLELNGNRGFGFEMIRLQAEQLKAQLKLGNRNNLIIIIPHTSPH